MQINKLVLPEGAPLDSALDYIGLQDMMLVTCNGEVFLVFKENHTTLRVFKSSSFVRIEEDKDE